MKIFLRDDEEKIIEVRKTRLILFGPFLLVFILITAPLFLLIPLLSIEIFGPSILAFSYFTALLYGLNSYLCWKKTGFVITNQRVFDFERKGFFEQTVTEANFSDIKDVYYQIQGPLNTLFRLGTITLETASSHNLELSRVPHPEQIADIIMKRRKEIQESTAGDELTKIMSGLKKLSRTEKEAVLLELKRLIKEELKTEDNEILYDS